LALVAGQASSTPLLCLNLHLPPSAAIGVRPAHSLPTAGGQACRKWRRPPESIRRPS
jgi:hypothetical protein